MNLKDIIDEVNSALDFNPELESYKSQVSRVINRHYLQISSQYPWLFRQKLTDLTLRADIKSKVVTHSDDSVENYNVIQVGENDHYDASNVLMFKGAEQAFPVREMLGNVIVFHDNSTHTSLTSKAHGTSEREFTITGIFDSAIEAAADGSTQGGYTGVNRIGGVDQDEFPDGYKNSELGGVIIDRPLIDPSTVTVAGNDITVNKKFYSDWTLEFRQYYLPADCVEVLGIVDRGMKLSRVSETATLKNDGTVDSTSIGMSTTTAPDRGRIIFIDSSKEEHLYLDRDTSGDPIVGIEGMVTVVDPPQVAPEIMSLPAAEFVDGDFLDITLTDGTSYKPFESYKADTDNLGLPIGEYEYCYTYIDRGVESAPSPIAKVGFSKSDKSGRVNILTSEHTEGVFSRNSTLGKTIAGADAGSGGSGTDGGARGLKDGDMETKTRYTGRVKRFYRRLVTPAGDLTNTVIAAEGITNISAFLTARVGNMGFGNGQWMHIGDVIGDRVAFDMAHSALKEIFPLETDTTSVVTMGNRFDSVVFFGVPSTYEIANGFWTYHDGEIQKIKNLDEAGPRQSIRIYRPPSQDMNVQIRYLSRPKRLMNRSDAPEWPVQYHHLLVYMTLRDICLKHGMTTQSQIYERKSDELLYQMKQKYLTRTNRKYVRRGFDQAVFSGERFGVPTKV